MKHRMLFLTVSVLCLMAMLWMPVLANAAEPPCLTVVVVGAPEDLALAMVDSSGTEEIRLDARRSVRGWETYFRYFYNHEALYSPKVGGYVQSDTEAKLQDLRLAVTHGGETVYLAMPALAYEHYNNVVLLDLDAMTLSGSLYPGRMALVIGLRVFLTLLIEGILFLAFGYRTAHSWGMFVCINLLTQLFLNLLIGNASMDSYVLFFYYLLEAVIVTAEAIAFPLALKEHRRRAVVYAILANLSSMLIGGMLITYLPLAL